MLNLRIKIIKSTLEKTANTINLLGKEIKINNGGFNSLGCGRPANSGLLLHFAGKCLKK